MGTGELARIAVVLALAACGGGRAPTVASNQAASPTARTHTAAPVTVAQNRRDLQHLVADASGVYWVERDEVGSSVIFVATGSATPSVLWHVDGQVNAAAVHAGSIYLQVYGNDETHRLLRRAVTGGEVTTLAKDVVAELFAIAGRELFAGGGGDIHAIPLDGAGKARKLTGSVEYSYMDGLAVSDHNVYFSNELDDTPHRIYRVPRGGGDADIVDFEGKLGGWVLVGSTIYMSIGDDEALVKLDAESPKAAATPLQGKGRPQGLVGDQLVLRTSDDNIVLRSLSSGAVSSPVPMGDMGLNAISDGALWLVRGSAQRGPDDEELVDLFMYVP